MKNTVNHCYYPKHSLRRIVLTVFVSMIISMKAAQSAEMGYVIYNTDISSGINSIEKIEGVSQLNLQKKSYVITTVGGYSITNNYTRSDKLKEEYNALLNMGVSIDIRSCKKLKYFKEVTQEYYDYSVCGAGVSTPPIDTNKILHSQYVEIDMTKVINGKAAAFGVIK